MVYDKIKDGWHDCQWHCPFPKEWVEMMRRAATVCKTLTPEQIEEAERNIEMGKSLFDIPPGEYLSEPQDSRGMPLSWCEEEERRFEKHPISCCATYDYRSIPEVVVTNGEDDWPLKIWKKYIIT